MSVSSLATKSVPADKSNYTVGRAGNKVKKITIHHMAGVLSAEACGKIFQRAGRGGSSHYGIGKDGDIANYVDENNTAWTDSNWVSNTTSVTIENSNSSTGGDWPVSDATLNSLVKLVADIAKRNNLGTLVPGQNLTWHSMYSNTTCPGNYLRSKMQYIADEANKINNASKTSTTTTTKKTNEQIADEVIAGKWGNGTDRKARLEKAGYKYADVQAIVNKKLGGGSTTTTKASTGIKVGSKVTLKSWVDYNGTRLAKTRNYYFVSEISGDRAVLRADSVKGAVYAAVKKSNLKEV